MRISDWSSDVCSSDLIEVGFVAHARPPLSEKTTHRPVHRFRCAAPSVTEPESFHRLRETAYPFGGLGPGPKALSRVSKPHAVDCACEIQGRLLLRRTGRKRVTIPPGPMPVNPQSQTHT